MKNKPNNRILLLNPPRSSITNNEGNIKLPLGLLYMAASLEKNGFEVKILDCPLDWQKNRKINETTVRIGTYSEEIKEEIKKFNPTIIGVSCSYTAYEQDSFEVIKTIKELEKEQNKKYLIVVGGAHTSANPEFVLRNKDINIAVIGEGEATIVEIAKKYIYNQNISNIEGTAINIKNKNFQQKKSFSIKINKSRQIIKNLDELKCAWHLIDLNKYFEHPDNSAATMRKNSVDLITSRGCPGNCVFCSIRTVWGRTWRSRSVKNVVDELEFLVNKYGVKQIRFQDDNMTLDKKRTIEICNEIIKRKIDIKWDTPNGVAFWTLDEDVLTKMKQAGCYRITLGIESCSPTTQKYIKKIVDLTKVNSIIDICHKLRIWVCATFIIGFPYETKEDIKTTTKYIIHSKVNYAFLYIAQPYQGTDLYLDFTKENLLDKFKDESNVFISKYNTKHFKYMELNKIRINTIKKFYRNKAILYIINPFIFYKEFLSKIRSIEDIKYIIKNLKGFINLSGTKLF